MSPPTSDECTQAFSAWLDKADEDSADSPLELAEKAFRAGWMARGWLRDPSKVVSPEPTSK